MPTPSEPATVERALARAVLCRWLRLLLLPGDGERLEVDGDAVRRAARRLEGDGQLGLRSGVGELLSLPLPPPDRLEAERERLYGHTLRGAVCPYECEYGSREPMQQAQELADLEGFYRAFGLRTVGHPADRADHVACELEFLEFLSAKEAWALDAGDDEMLAVTRQAARKFLRRHLGRFGRAFAHGLERASGEEFYRRLARSFDAFLRVVCAGFRVEVGPELLELRSAEEDRVPMACGSDTGLVQIGGGAGVRFQGG